MNRRAFLLGAGAVVVATQLPKLPIEIPLEVYGRSPAMDALPDVRELQAIRLSWMQHWEELAKYIEPKRINWIPYES